MTWFKLLCFGGKDCAMICSWRKGKRMEVGTYLNVWRWLSKGVCFTSLHTCLQMKLKWYVHVPDNYGKGFVHSCRMFVSVWVSY